jgi:hypothetical protein
MERKKVKAREPKTAEREGEEVMTGARPRLR